jgi:hypothetical protein
MNKYLFGGGQVEIIKKIFVLILAFLTLSLFTPKFFRSDEANLCAKEIKTKHQVEILATPEVEMAEKEEQVKSNWWWLGLLGAAVIGGVAALAGGGGSGSGGGDDGDDTGSYNYSW